MAKSKQIAWRDWVAWPPPERRVRRVIYAWQWRYMQGDVLILRPLRTAPHVVVVDVLETSVKLDVPDDMSDIPMARVRVHFAGGTEELPIPNASVLRYGSRLDHLTKAFLEAPLADHLRMLESALSREGDTLEAAAPPEPVVQAPRKMKQLSLFGGSLE